MISQQVLEYIRQQLATGITKEEITKALISQGWSEGDVNANFAVLKQPPVAPIPASFPSAAISPIMPVTEAKVSPEVNASKPSSVNFFEALMYVSIAISIGVLFFRYGQYITLQHLSISLYTVFLPLSLMVGRLIFVFLAARRRMNWARIVLLALLVTHFGGLFSIFGIFTGVSFNPVLALLSLAPILLEVAAICFAFSRSANNWFEPAPPTVNGSLPPGVESKTWSKNIPRTNIGFMGVSLLLVFGLDLMILLSNPELAPFFWIMLVVLGIFGVFFYFENYVFKKRFSFSHSKIDTWLYVLIVLRNLVFLLNFIPVIQIAGMAALMFGGIPFVILYSILLSRRSKVV